MRTVIDLFCGSGGISLGFKMAGFKPILGIDKDGSSINTYKLNFPEANIIQKDINEIDTDLILELSGEQPIDVLAGGPPCQGFSLSGPREITDPRNSLFLFYLKMIETLFPKVVLVENVPGFASLYHGKAKDLLIKQLEKYGYRVSWKILNSKNYGIPQSRRRIFFVGVKDSVKEFIFPSPTHVEDNLFSTKSPPITVKAAISDLPSLEGSFGEEKQEYPGKPENTYQELMREGSEFIYNHIATKHHDRTINIIRMVPDGGNYKDLPEEYRNTRNFHVAWTRFDSNKPAPTIDTGHRHHFHYKYNRVPTVRESARIQSFPDNFVFTGSKTSQYRQVGNAVPPLLIEVIAQKILEDLC